MNYKQLTKQVYDEYAEQFEINTAHLFESAKVRDVEPFLNSLDGNRILDLGSGPGIHSLYFKQIGLKPICLDISFPMLKLCRKKGLEVVLGDLENLPFRKNTFNGVWACTSLLHIPKANLPKVLKNINEILGSQGIFYISMKQGNFEGEIESDKYPGMKRFFALYQDDELKKILSRDFDIFHATQNSSGNALFLNYLCKVRR